MADDGAAGTNILDSFPNASVDDLLHLARITETAERFEDMCAIMGSLVQMKAANNEPLEVEERNMLSVAYKNVVGQRRASWRTLKSEDDVLANREDLKNDYKAIVETELSGKCLEVLNLLRDHLVDDSMQADQYGDQEISPEIAVAVETQVFYLKMCGDYYRYLAEFSDNDDYKTNAGQQYEKALDLAKITLQPTHPTRLGLALNASVCYYEIMKKPQKACALAKAAFDDAIQKLDSLSDSTYKDSTLIMQLLRDNLTIWTSEDKDNIAEERED